MNLIIEDVRRLIVRPEIIKAGLFININIRFYHLFHYNIPPLPPYNNKMLSKKRKNLSWIKKEKGGGGGVQKSFSRKLPSLLIDVIDSIFFTFLSWILQIEFFEISSLSIVKFDKFVWTFSSINSQKSLYTVSCHFST